MCGVKQGTRATVRARVSMAKLSVYLADARIPVNILGFLSMKIAFHWGFSFPPSLSKQSSIKRKFQLTEFP